VDFTLLRVDMDNGYDGWSIDNSRISQVDRPGKDSQNSTGASARVTTALKGATLTLIGAYADSDIVNSFDGDWGNPVLWAPYTYDFFERTTRNRKTASVEARLASDNDEGRAVNWLFGVYAMQLREQLGDSNTGTLLDPADPASIYLLDDSLASRYRANNLAVFADFDGKFADRWHWSVGARLEQRDARYSDSGIQTGEPEVTKFNSHDFMQGGEVSLSYEVTPKASAYVSLSRGYKAGGFNLHTEPGTPKEYQPEFLWSLETGLKGSWFDGQIVATSALFYERRRDMQIRNGVQLTAGDPNSYVFITENAAGGYNYGLESTLQWRATQSFSVESSLGLLRTRFIDYQPAAVDLSNRDQAQSPRYQFAIAGIWRTKSGWMTRVDLTGMDSFYFDVPPNDTRSHAYALTNVKVGYQTQHWSAYAWGRNIFDRTYAIRGFFFNDTPAGGDNQLYIQRGDPRTVGLTVDWRLN
jgi:iron complex outermembrane receptor protein